MEYLSAVRRSSFNPSVGILWGGTTYRKDDYIAILQFQSLGRDSVGWDRSGLQT